MALRVDFYGFLNVCRRFERIVRKSLRSTWRYTHLFYSSYKRLNLMNCLLPCAA